MATLVWVGQKPHVSDLEYERFIQGNSLKA